MSELAIDNGAESLGGRPLVQDIGAAALYLGLSWEERIVIYPSEGIVEQLGVQEAVGLDGAGMLMLTALAEQPNAMVGYRQLSNAAHGGEYASYRAVVAQMSRIRNKLDDSRRPAIATVRGGSGYIGVRNFDPPLEYGQDPRRIEPVTIYSYRGEPLTIDSEKRCLRYSGSVNTLSPRYYLLIKALADNVDTVVSPAELKESVWPDCDQARINLPSFIYLVYRNVLPHGHRYNLLRVNEGYILRSRVLAQK